MGPEVAHALGISEVGLRARSGWSEEEERRFAEAVSLYERDFELVQESVPGKSLAQLVSYYYNCWKNSCNATSQRWNEERRRAKQAEREAVSMDMEARAQAAPEAGGSAVCEGSNAPAECLAA